MPRRSLVLKAVAAFVLIAALVIAVRLLPISDELTRFQRWVRGQGATGYVVYAVVYAVCVVFLVPASVMTIGAGVIFGVIPGTLVVICGGTVGATIAFLLARGVLRPRVERWAARDPRYWAIDRAVTREGTKIVFLIRLSVLFPFTWVNYVLGLTGVRTGTYVMATLIGIAPATLAFVYIGAVAGEAANAAGQLRVAVYLLGAATALIVSILIGRLASREIARAVR